MEFYIGQIIMFGGNFAIRGFALAQGQLLPISQNTALFSLYGTIYGGDGRTTFALPDLRGRTPIQEGRGPGLSDYRIGQKGGVENVTLNISQIPSHDHDYHAGSGPANSPSPGNKLFAGNVLPPIYTNNETLEAMNSKVIGLRGGGQSHTNVQPYLTINFEVALTGIFPSRS